MSFHLSGDTEQPLRPCGCTGNVRSTLLRESKQENDACLNQIFHMSYPISATAMSLTFVPVGPVLSSPSTASSA